MSTNSLTTAAVPTGKVKIASWVLRGLAAAAFLAAGGAKLTGVPMMVGIYEQIGIGQWFRIVTGVVEVAGAIGLLIPATAGLGGLMLAVTMACAVMTHLFVIGGSAIPALVLMVITGTVGWLHRASITGVLNSLR
jgi:uncharacterized membrane protein